MNSVDSRYIYVTGVCFFGSQLRGMMTNKTSVLFYRHVVSNRTAMLEAGEVIESVYLSDDGCYSKVSMNQLFLSYLDVKNHAKSIGRDFLFYVHLPTAEYVLSSFDLIRRQGITAPALLQYWSILRKEHKAVARRIEKMCPKSVIYSPMQGFLEMMLNEDYESHLLALAVRDVESFKANVLAEEDIGRVGVEHDYYSTTATYTDLAKYSYVSALAASRLRHPKDVIIACDVYNEIPISLQYKRYFEKQFGELNVLAYLPLVTAHEDGEQLTDITYYNEFNQVYLHPSFWDCY